MTWVALAILVPVWFASGASVLQFLLREIGEVVRQVQGRDALYAELGEILWAAACLTVFTFASLGLIALNIPVL